MVATLINNALLVAAALAGVQPDAGETNSVQSDTPRSKTAPLELASDEEVDLATLKCWDAVTLNEQDRGFTMVLMFGFAIGQKNASKVSAQDIQVGIVQTMQECVDKPDALVLDVLKSHLN